MSVKKELYQHFLLEKQRRMLSLGRKKEVVFFVLMVMSLVLWNRFEYSQVVSARFGGVSSNMYSGDVYKPSRHKEEDPYAIEPYGGGEFVSVADLDSASGKVKRNKKIILPQSGVARDYRKVLHEIERDISYWGNSNDKSVYFFGTRYFFLLYFRIYAKAFQQHGFTVRRRPQRDSGSSSLTQLDLGRIKSSAVICLSYSNYGCFRNKYAHMGLKRYQRINRVSYLRETIWDKGNFCKTLSAGTKSDMRFKDFTFPCWIIPQQLEEAKQWARAHPTEKFISKPLQEGAGKGIKVVEGISGLKSMTVYSKPHLAQQYLPNPHLINGYKWDIRAYILVSSTVPIRVYMYERGIVRFASSKYGKSDKKTGMLTNTYVNKKNNKNVTELTWSYAELEEHLNRNGQSYDSLLDGIKSAVSVVFLSAEGEWRKKYLNQKDSCSNCYQPLGVDVIVDDQMNARVIEVNSQPNLLVTQDKDDHYSITKMKMIHDMVSLIYNTDSSVGELVKSLRRVKPALLKALTKREWVYLIDYMNERKNLNGWMPVYPNTDILDIHDTFMSLHEKTLPPERVALHKILTILERDKGDDLVDLSSL